MVIPVQVGQGPELQCLNFSRVGFLGGGQLFCWNEFACGKTKNYPGGCRLRIVIHDQLFCYIYSFYIQEPGINGINYV